VATLPAPHTWVANDDATSTNLQSLTDALNFMLAPPRCRAYQSVAQTLTTGTTGAVVTMTSEDIDTDGIHSTSTNTSRMTIVTAGRYLVVAQTCFVSNATGHRDVRIMRNGTRMATSRGQATNGQDHYQQCVDEVLCSAGDYIEMLASQGSGGNLDTVTGSANTFLHVVWVGTT
jgi:hypothetical protein